MGIFVIVFIVFLIVYWVHLYRNELYKECCTALQGGLLLTEKRFNAIREALYEAFRKVDEKLLNWYAIT